MNDQGFGQTTHFGFKVVRLREKTHHVAGVFHSVASKYDAMNDLMSIGIHRFWKRQAVAISGVRNGQTVLDLAGGTGDLAIKFSDIVGSHGQVVLADINDSMIRLGRDRLIDKAIVSNVHYVQTDAESLPFQEHTFDCVAIAFGLRNVTDKQKALTSMVHVLKPGGRLLILEFSKTQNPWLTKAYDAYSFNILPKMGKLITNDEDSYRYLAESIRMHPDQETLKGMMQQVGLANCGYYNMTGGIVAMHFGMKP
jgi:demethylmenaquinone methyltransferase/2-methoxy-6-polyprenyl-1,4-benzoquinol methylase